MLDGAIAISFAATAGWIVVIEGPAHIETDGTSSAPVLGMALGVGDLVSVGDAGTVVVRLADGGAMALGAGARAIVGDQVATEAGIPWPSVAVLEGPAALTGAPDAGIGSPLLMALLPQGVVEIVGGPVLLDDGAVRLADPLGKAPTEVHVVAGAIRVPLTELGVGFAIGRGIVSLGGNDTVDPALAALAAWLESAYGDIDPSLAATFAGPALEDLAPAAGPADVPLGTLDALLDALRPEAAPAAGTVDFAPGLSIESDAPVREGPGAGP